MHDKQGSAGTQADRHQQSIPERISAALAITLSLMIGLMVSAHARTALAISFDNCTIGNDVSSIAADCAQLSVPVDRETASSESMVLHIARLVATGRRALEDPLVLIAGGPGQAATEAFPAIISAFRHLRRHRDLLLIDQRGTGESMRLDCPAQSTTDTLQMDTALVRAEAARCLKTLDVDVRQFTTSVAVQDLEAVRQALEIEHWNLYGVSYGTRVVQHYARRFPDRVRSMILDGVVPADVPLGPDIALHAQRALDLILRRCENARDCNTAFPHIGKRTAELLQQLASTPESIRFEDISDGQQRRMDFSQAHLAITLRLMSYTAHGAALLPSMLAEAIDEQNFAPLARQARLQIDSLDTSLATGMHQSVVCTEDAGRVDAEALRPALQDTYLGVDLLDALLAACSQWPAGVLDADFAEPLNTAIPALVLSGEADPVTPPEYGERLMQTLHQARHLINAGQGHTQAHLGCIPRLMQAFVSELDPESLDISCLERLQPMPFFIDANGPLP